MQVDVFVGEMLIGVAVLEHLDSPMGVVFGPFSPTHAYAVGLHANVIEGQHVGDKGLLLKVTAAPHGVLNASIAIQDYGENGRELMLRFTDGAAFAELFATHPDYTAYSQSTNDS